MRTTRIVVVVLFNQIVPEVAVLDLVQSLIVSIRKLNVDRGQRETLRWGSLLGRR